MTPRLLDLLSYSTHTTPPGQVVRRGKRLMARKTLLTELKEFTRANEAVTAERRRPYNEARKDMRLSRPWQQDPAVGNLYDDKEELIMYYFIFAQGGDQGCGVAHIRARVSPTFTTPPSPSPPLVRKSPTATMNKPMLPVQHNYRAGWEELVHR